MRYQLLFLILIGSMWSVNTHAQQADSLKQVHINYLSKTLSVSQSKAQQVVSILDQYKQEAKAAVNNKSLKDDERKVKLDQLIDEKNSKLKKILTEQQLQKIVPSTEKP